MKRLIARFLMAVPALTVALTPAPIQACAVCFGQTDSALAEGLHWGVLSLLAVVATVLTGVASFFVYLARRAATMPEVLPAEPATAHKESS